MNDGGTNVVNIQNHVKLFFRVEILSLPLQDSLTCSLALPMNLPFFHQVRVAGGHDPTLRHSRYERACDTDRGSPDADG